MLKNYLKTAIRNLFREKGSAMINLAGLTLGITCSLVLFLLVKFHYSFDDYHSKRDRIYRIVNQSEGNAGTEYQSGVPTVLPDAFRTDFSEVEKVVFVSYRSEVLVTIPQTYAEPKKYTEESGVVYTESAFFEVFDRPIIQGEARTSLDEPNEAIIAKSWALKYFGKEDVIGQVIKVENREYQIKAVMEDAPANTDLPFQIMLSYTTIKREREESGWNSIWSDEQCYFLLKSGESIANIESRMPAFSEKYLGKDDPDKTRFFTQPLSDLHFDERFEVLSYNTVSRSMLMVLSIVGLILVITACINFINLTTAEAIKRSKEVGIRKTLGSTRGQLVMQFLGETSLVTVASVIISLGLVQLVLTFINPFMELTLELDFMTNPQLWIYLIGVTVLVSVLSGLYPAFVVSGFNPAISLKNQANNKNTSGYMLRKVLVIVQFCISQVFIIGTIVIVKQMDYFQQKDLGFTKEAVLVVPIPESGKIDTLALHKMRTLRDEMSNVSGVDYASLSSAPPSAGGVSQTNFKFQGGDDIFLTQVKQVDSNYLDLYNIELVAGHNLSDLDTVTGFIVNEKLTEVAGFKKPDEMLGKVIRVWRKEYPVVGIVKNFHTVSLREPIEATVMFNRLQGYDNLALKINMSKAQAIIDELKDKWSTAYPDYIFEYQFLDDSIQEFYEGEQRMSILFTVFSSIAIFIGCLGLFGLATFMANQKTKEVGVRKVLGASVESIVFMFSREYVKLILIGFVIAAPLAWYVMGLFLNEFTYKINLGAGIFIIALLVTLIVAVLTVGYRSFKAAVVNPVKSLRSE